MVNYKLFYMFWSKLFLGVNYQPYKIGDEKEVMKKMSNEGYEVRSES